MSLNLEENARFVIEETSDNVHWDVLVRSSPQGTIFNQSSFLYSLGYKFNRYLILRDDNIVAFFSTLKDDAEVSIVRVDFAPYQGILFIDQGFKNVRQEIHSEFLITTFIIKWLTENYNSVELSLSWNFKDVRPFVWHNYNRRNAPHFQLLPHYTGILNIGQINKESIFANARLNRRRDLRIARLFSVKEEFDVEQFLLIYSDMFKSKSITLSAEKINLVRSITVNALRGGYGHLMSCSGPDGVASMSLFLKDNRRAYYVFGANKPEMRHSGAATKLMFENIYRAKESGIQELDFVGVNSPQRGDFKLSFNAELKLYFNVRFYRTMNL